MTKHLYVLAGPNGSGKSTLYKARFNHLPFVNPDVIEQNLAGSSG